MYHQCVISVLAGLSLETHFAGPRRECWTRLIGRRLQDTQNEAVAEVTCSRRPSRVERKGFRWWFRGRAVVLPRGRPDPQRSAALPSDGGRVTVWSHGCQSHLHQRCSHKYMTTRQTQPDACTLSTCGAHSPPRFLWVKRALGVRAMSPSRTVRPSFTALFPQGSKVTAEPSQD